MYPKYQKIFHITTSSLEPRPLEERYPNRKKSTKFDAKLQKIEHDDQRLSFNCSIEESTRFCCAKFGKFLWTSFFARWR